jgi:hypothetical protein
LPKHPLSISTKMHYSYTRKVDVLNITTRSGNRICLMETASQKKLMFYWGLLKSKCRMNSNRACTAENGHPPIL